MSFTAAQIVLLTKFFYPQFFCRSSGAMLRISSYSVGSTPSEADVTVYDATFLSDLICRVRGYVPDSVARDDDGDIFTKKMLLLPFHRQCQWSLVVVLNPGAVISCEEKGHEGGLRPCILFLDPLGSDTKHDKKIIASKLLIWLNKRWRDRPGAKEDDRVPFSHRTTKVYTPAGKIDSRL